MPTYKNIADYAIRISGEDVAPGENVIINRKLDDARFLLVDHNPRITSLSIQKPLAEALFDIEPVLPFTWLAASGYYPGMTPYKKFGYNASVGTTTETIWDKGGLYVYPSEALLMYIASTDVDDTLLGDGARKVRVSGLDSDYEFVEFDVELSGQTPVEVGTMLRVFRATVIDAGTVSGAQGVISISDGTYTLGVPDGTTYAQIVDGGNQTLMALITIPAGYTGYISNYYTNSGKSGELVVDSFVRPFGQLNFNMVRRVMSYENTFAFPNDIPFRFSEKTDIEIRATAAATDAPCAAGFDMLLIRN